MFKPTKKLAVISIFRDERIVRYRLIAANKSGSTYFDCTLEVTGGVAPPVVVTQVLVTPNARDFTNSTVQVAGKVVVGAGSVGVPSTTAEYGFCWNTDQRSMSLTDPTAQHIVGNGSAASFTGTLSGLIDKTTYYVRAYAKPTPAVGNNDVSYGEILPFFFTKPAFPSN